MSEHWTTQQAEEAAKVPDEARPYCWTHRRRMAWFGCWACPECNPWLDDIKGVSADERPAEEGRMMLTN